MKYTLIEILMYNRLANINATTKQLNAFTILFNFAQAGQQFIIPLITVWIWDVFMTETNWISSCLQRQVTKALRITSSKTYIINNSKSKFHQAPIVRANVAALLEREQVEEEWGVAGGAKKSQRQSSREREEGEAARSLGMHFNLCLD